MRAERNTDAAGTHYESSSPKAALRVLLVGPKPPWNGGIASVINSILAYAGKHTDLSLRIVDTAPRWKAFTDCNILKRAIFGGFVGIRDVCAFCVQCLAWKPHVVHLTSSGSLAVLRDMVFASVAKIMRRPIVLQVHHGRIPDLERSNNWEWWAIKKTFILFDRVAVLDQESQSVLNKACVCRKVSLIPNGIALRESSAREKADPQRPVVLYVGSVIQSKGIYELVDSWKSINCDAWELRIVGPAEQTFLIELAERAGPSIRTIEFLGSLSHERTLEQIDRCEIFVLPSHTEGHPQVILEAMSAGKAIVATHVGAVSEMLATNSPEPSGVTIPPRDPVSLTTALLKLMFDPSSRRVLGSRACQRVRQEYSIDGVMAQMVTMWMSARKTNTFSR